MSVEAFESDNGERLVDERRAEQLEAVADELLRASGVTEPQPTLDDDIWAGQDSGKPMNQDLVRVYLDEIGKRPLLDAAQEVELSKAIEAGLYAAHLLETPEGRSRAEIRDLQQLAREGDSAKTRMLESNLRLVVSLAKRYTGRGMPLLDLIQEGNLGLVRAVEKFDYAKGFKFSTYATWWIRQAITRGMADQGRTIRIPVHMLEVINKMGHMQRDHVQEFGSEMTEEELAEQMNLPVKKIRELIGYAREPISLDMEVGDSEESTLGSFVEDRTQPSVEEQVLLNQLDQEIGELLDGLEPREALVLRHRYGLQGYEKLTLDQIGQIVGLTRERIRQIEQKTMSKVRHPNRAGKLRAHFE